MTIYQEELLRKLPQFGCIGRYDPESGLLCVTYEQHPLCKQDADGFLRFRQDQLEADGLLEQYDRIQDEAQKIREYVGIYEASPQMTANGVTEYRKFAEYGDIVLAGMYSEQYGFMFTTWEQDKTRHHVSGGDYSPNYSYVKEAFVCRAGLVDKQRLFTEDEAANLYRCIDYAKNNCGTLSYDQEKELDALAEKLSYGYPELENHPPSFEQEAAPQMNL